MRTEMDNCVPAIALLVVAYYMVQDQLACFFVFVLSTLSGRSLVPAVSSRGAGHRDRQRSAWGCGWG